MLDPVDQNFTAENEEERRENLARPTWDDLKAVWDNGTAERNRGVSQSVGGSTGGLWVTEDTESTNFDDVSKSDNDKHQP